MGQAAFIAVLFGTGCVGPLGDETVEDDDTSRELASAELSDDELAAERVDDEPDGLQAEASPPGDESAPLLAGPLGSGWVQYSPTKKIHLNDDTALRTFNWTAKKSVCNPTCADYSYDSRTDTETFRLLDHRTNRSEIRLQNEYSSGSRQFQGYVRFDAPLNDESLFQIFGSSSGATQLMLRGYAAKGGSIRGGGKTLVTGIYGVERRVNVIHRQGNDIRIYINGSLKHTIRDDENVTNYHKYGCYGTLRTGPVTVNWRAVRSYRDGQAL
jgi:hypothetical protein